MIDMRTKNGMEIIIILREGAVEFLKTVTKYFNVYFFSYIGRDLLIEIIEKILDPKGTLILKRNFDIHRSNCRVWTYTYPMLKNPDDLFIGFDPNLSKPSHAINSFFIGTDKAYELRDFLIVDRNEHMWPTKFKNRIILTKTFAPLTGQLILDESLIQFPVQIN